MKNLVYAELVNGINMVMMIDKKVRIISDGALFIVMTEEHSKEYPELEFEPTDLETLEEYNVNLKSFENLH